jgi:hypothetical protein
MWYSLRSHPKNLKIVENRRTSSENFFWAMSWISFKIHLIHPKFDGDHESVSYFDLSSIVEEISVCSGVLLAKIEFSNCLKVKSELYSPYSFFQFKHSLRNKGVVY